MRRNKVNYEVQFGWLIKIEYYKIQSYG